MYKENAYGVIEPVNAKVYESTLSTYYVGLNNRRRGKNGTFHD